MKKYDVKLTEQAKQDGETAYVHRIIPQKMVIF